MIWWAKFFGDLHVVAGNDVPQLTFAAKEHIVKIRDRHAPMLDDGEFLAAVVSKVGNFVAGRKVLNDNRF